MMRVKQLEIQLCHRFSQSPPVGSRFLVSMRAAVTVEAATLSWFGAGRLSESTPSSAGGFRFCSSVVPD